MDKVQHTSGRPCVLRGLSESKRPETFDLIITRYCTNHAVASRSTRHALSITWGGILRSVQRLPGSNGKFRTIGYVAFAVLSSLVHRWGLHRLK
jgi:hypothetical protein